MSLHPFESASPASASPGSASSGSGGAARGPAARRIDAVLWTVAGMLLCVAVVAFGWGVFQAWARDGDGDMQRRLAEYDWFRQGIYPNRHLAGPDAPRGLPYTVYPPYALPMFAFFFEPDGLVQGRTLLQLLSLASLVVIGWHGFRSLRSAGPPVAAIGAVAGAAIVANATALALGQFSILCVGLIVQQQLFLERRRQYAAGVCWAVAMIKPQIALPFALLFLVGRQWRGLLLGLAIVAALGLFACRWTGIPPERIARYWMFEMPLFFAAISGGIGPGPVALRLGIDVRIVVAVGLALFGVLAATAAWFWLRHADRLAVAPLAGVAAVLGELFLYHYHYDNIMLAPAVIGILGVAASSRAPVTIALAALMMATVLLPLRVTTAIPCQEIGRAAIWSAVGAVLMRHSVAGGWAWPGGRDGSRGDKKTPARL